MGRWGRIREKRVEWDRILRHLRRSKELKFPPSLESQTEGIAGAPAVSGRADDFIPKAAVTELFPKKESVTVYKKGRIAQLESQASDFTCLCDECQNVWGHLSLFPVTGNRLALLGECLGRRPQHTPLHIFQRGTKQFLYQ